MAATRAFELPFKYPNATWKRALGSRHAKPDRDLPGDQQQLHLIDSFMISRHVLSCRDAAYPEKKHEWSRSCGTPVREARSLNRVPLRAEHRTAALRPLAAGKSPLL